MCALVMNVFKKKLKKRRKLSSLPILILFKKTNVLDAVFHTQEWNLEMTPVDYIHTNSQFDIMY